MGKVYVARCLVKRNGKNHEKGSVIEGLTGDEIKRGLAEKWLQAIGAEESPTEDGESKPKSNKKDKKKKGEEKARETLLKQAEEAGISVTEEMTDEEIQKLISEAAKAE